jgi:hypothetical protein
MRDTNEGRLETTHLIREYHIEKERRWMQVRHNFGPETGPQNTAISSQKSVNTDSQTELDGHACAINGNNRGRCRAWEGSQRPGETNNATNGLTPALRCFAQHHNWHDPGIYTNKRILRRVFAKPIAKAVAELALDRKTAIAAQIQTDFARLQETTRSLDQMCIKRIDEDDEEVVFEHIKEQLNKIILALAAMLESGQKSSRKIVDIPTDESKNLRPESHLSLAGEEQWVTMTEAAQMLGKHPGTISYWVQTGKVTDNGKKRYQRRVLKADVALIKQDIEEKDLRKDIRDLRKDAKRII